ncbi:hypothetical protein BJ944DRAFT_253744 [Cunninghamella echinulata]|nr:hypothetical protein BJ944DRAFT_253744 [Cunninghamella echinulata]
MFKKVLRKRAKVDYEEADIPDIKSTSYWEKETSTLFKINTIDCSMEEMFNKNNILLDEETKKLLLPEWLDEDWLLKVDLDELNIADGRIKTLLGKIQYVVKAQRPRKEFYVDGYMSTFLPLLGFDTYPLYMYPQYEYSADIFDEQHVVAKLDFGILSKEQKLVIVTEDKTVINATYSNNWKEDQILGELFVAVHDTVKNYKDVTYPINIFAIRVVGTLFTFFKTIVGEDYVMETLKGYPKNSSMEVQRHPTVINKPYLTAYDVCNISDRENILKCMLSIKNFLRN